MRAHLVFQSHIHGLQDAVVGGDISNWFSCSFDSVQMAAFDSIVWACHRHMHNVTVFVICVQIVYIDLIGTCGCDDVVVALQLFRQIDDGTFGRLVNITDSSTTCNPLTAMWSLAPCRRVVGSTKIRKIAAITSLRTVPHLKSTSYHCSRSSA